DGAVGGVAVAEPPRFSTSPAVHVRRVDNPAGVVDGCCYVDEFHPSGNQLRGGEAADGPSVSEAPICGVAPAVGVPVRGDRAGVVLSGAHMRPGCELTHLDRFGGVFVDAGAELAIAAFTPALQVAAHGDPAGVAVACRQLSPVEVGGDGLGAVAVLGVADPQLAGFVRSPAERLVLFGDGTGMLPAGGDMLPLCEPGDPGEMRDLFQASLVPSPTWPRLLRPQQARNPLDSNRPQVWFSPATSILND